LQQQALAQQQHLQQQANWALQLAAANLYSPFGGMGGFGHTR